MASWTLERLLASATHNAATGCRTLPALPGKKGYARVYVDGRPRAAHRLCFTLSHGPIPVGKIVMHSCDVRNCIEPMHIRAGTVLENNLDRDEKQRQPRGETHGMRVLTEESVREMRRLAARRCSLQYIAERFGTSRKNVHRIVKLQAWAHLDASDVPLYRPCRPGRPRTFPLAPVRAL